MRVLLDHCVPAPFARWLGGHEVRTVRQVGWAALGDAAILAAARGRFDVVLTVDREFGRTATPPPRVRVVVLSAPSNRVRDLRRCAPALLRDLDRTDAPPVTWIVADRE